MISLGNGLFGEGKCVERKSPLESRHRIIYTYIKLNPNARIWWRAASERFPACSDNWDLASVPSDGVYESDDYYIGDDPNALNS